MPQEEETPVENTLTLPEPSAEEAAQMEIFIAQMLAEMDTLRSQMEQDQAEIETLKSETKAMQAETRAVLATLPRPGQTYRQRTEYVFTL